MPRNKFFPNYMAIALFASFLGVGIFLGGGAQASDRSDGIAFHQQAVDGVKGAAERASMVLEQYLKEKPNDARARAYLGSAYAMQARDASAVANKLRYVNKGLDRLDHAVELAPNDFVVRLIRANVQNSLPALFGREEKAVEDMLLLDQLFWKNPDAEFAGAMILIYQKLSERAPEQGAWQKQLDNVKKLQK